MVVVSAGHLGGTRDSGIVSSAAEALWMSVVRGIRVGGVGEMCMCLARRGVDGEGGEWMRFGLYQSYGDRESVGRVSVFGLRWCGWCMWGVGRGLGPGPGAVG